MRLFKGKNGENRRGSALLVVLGFLSFMVISAVSFAIFMRTERRPSSVVRNSIATGNLLKAAMSKAISRVDRSVGDNKYPGVSGDDRYHWIGRVFFPGGSGQTRTVSPDETVSVLNLESLGYLPPPLINDARYLSRCSAAAKWEMLPYDSGRFAYCAVNVSDYFDVNLLTGVGMRSSSPESRISPAYLFRTVATPSGNRNEGFAAASAARLEEFTTGVFNHGSGQWSSGGNMPETFFTPMDYNVRYGDYYCNNLGIGWPGESATGGDPVAQFYSPFYHYFVAEAGKLPQERAGLYGGGAGIDPTLSYNIKMAMRQPFVTGSSGEETDASSNKKRLSKEYQPFSESVIVRESRQVTFQQLMSENFYTEMGGNMARTDPKACMAKLDFMSLFDYLDADSVPYSLAMPCAERVPMVCSVGLGSMLCGINVKREAGPTQVNGKLERKTTKFGLDLANLLRGQLEVEWAYPFKRVSDPNRRGNFRIQAMIKVALVQSDAAPEARCRFAAAAPLVAKAEKCTNWQTSGWTRDGGDRLEFTYVTDAVKINLNASPEEQADAVGKAMLPIKSANGIFPLVERVEIKPTAGALPPLPDSKTVLKFVKRPYNPDGSEITANVGAELDAAAYDLAFGDKKYYPHLSIWVRVVDDSNNVVDLVPASLTDDVDCGRPRNSGIDMAVFLEAGIRFNNEPLMPFIGKDPAISGELKSGNLGAAFADIQKQIGPDGWGHRKLGVFDPRFNWAPEDLLVMDGSGSWIDWVKTALAAENGRSPDIFTYTSDLGKLQSMGELAFLPALGTRTFKVDGRTTLAAGLADTLSYNLAWRGIDVWGVWGNLPSSDYVCPIEDPEPVLGVNPYTSSPEIMLAAVSFTPNDWWAAAGDSIFGYELGDFDYCHDLKATSKPTDDLLNKLNKYTFSGGAAADSRMEFRQLRNIAGAIMNGIQNNLNRDWTESFDDMFYSDFGGVDPADENSFENFLGQKASTLLHSVDRKFLHAFWRGSFANRQQLFLVFARAESSALGDHGVQEGARAAALVWRDPNPHPDAPGGSGDSYSTSYIPHRTRVLFYRQMD